MFYVGTQKNTEIKTKLILKYSFFFILGHSKKIYWELYMHSQNRLSLANSQQPIRTAIIIIFRKLGPREIFLKVTFLGLLVIVHLIGQKQKPKDLISDLYS